MARAAATTLVFDDLRGGRNGVDPPSKLLPGQCVEALNVDWWRGALANRRSGAALISTTVGSVFTAVLDALIRYVPDNDETAAELWGVDDGGRFGRLAGSTTWASPTLADAAVISGSIYDAVGVALGGFLHLGYKTSQNRSHVWDTNVSKVRRSGLATPAAPTVAADGAGGLSWTRYYRVRYIDLLGSVVRRRSEASPVVSITIAGKLGVTVTKPTGLGEDETHWELEAASAAAGPWYRLVRTANAQTTADDTSATIDTTNLSATDGTNYPPPSFRWAVSSESRMVMAGCYESTGGYVSPSNSRVWWTPVLGSTDVGDAERIPTGNYIQFDTALTGLGGPLNGIVYVFGYRRIWKIVPTGNVASPYQRYTVSTSLGCIRHQSIIAAEDESGTPCLYFLTHRGPYRMGPNGLQYLGRDIEDVWSTINLGASIPCHGVHHADKHQVWWWIATGSNDTPDTKLVFDTRLGQSSGEEVRKGWAKHTSDSAAARCAVLFSNTLGSAMSRDLKPHIGQGGGSSRVWKCDTGTDDNGTAFQGYVDTAEVFGAGYGQTLALDQPYVVGQVSSGVTITVTGRSNFGQRSDATGTVSLTATGSETRVQRKVEGFQTADITSAAFRVGDASTASLAWTLDALVVPLRHQGDA